MKKKRTPSKEELKRWKTIPPTKPTIKYLQDIKIPAKVIKELKTQYDAHIFINNMEDKK